MQSARRYKHAKAVMYQSAEVIPLTSIVKPISAGKTAPPSPEKPVIKLVTIRADPVNVWLAYTIVIE